MLKSTADMRASSPYYADKVILEIVPVTIESAREAAAPLLRGERDGWVDLPCGGSVLIESGALVRVSDGASNSDETTDWAHEIEMALGIRVDVVGGSWRRDAVSGEWTAALKPEDP